MGKGIIIFYSKSKRFGFIRPDDMDEHNENNIYFDKREIHGNIIIGDHVYYQVKKFQKVMRAIKIYKFKS